MSQYPPRCDYDAEDPFGSRPDEKPPAGWDAGFWEAVRDRIEDGREDPAASRPPASPKRGRRAAGAAITVLVAAAALALFASRPSGPAAPDPNEPSLIHVRVDGSADPLVSVEWARTGGVNSGYVVLRSLDPEVSYVLIDQRLELR